MNKEKEFREKLLKDVGTHAMTVRQIKDTDVGNFYEGEKAKFISWECFVKTIDNLLPDMKF